MNRLLPYLKQGDAMHVTDLDEKNRPLYFVCLSDWSDEMKEAGDHKKNWYSKMRERGLRVKIAIDDEGNTGGMIQYLPIEESLASGNGLYFINCIWVHGYKKGRGNFQKKGMGKALLQAAESDARELGAKGIAAWGISLPFWMKASWYKKYGYIPADKKSGQILLWKSFTGDAEAPAWRKRKRDPELVMRKVTVTALINGWCPAGNLTIERAKRAAEKFRDRVVFQEIDTTNMETFNEWGILDGLYIDGREVRTGPPPSYKKLERLIRRRVKKL